MDSPEPPGSFSALAPELVQHVLSFLSLHDLLNASRCSKALRYLATDPLLHAKRLQAASHTLEAALQSRPARQELLRRRTPLISLTPNTPSIYLNSPGAATQIQAFLAVSRLIVRSRLRRAIERRSAKRSLSEAGLLDAELGGPAAMAFSLVPMMRQLKKAQKADLLRKGMRAHDSNEWRTPIEMFEGGSRHLWREDDPRVISAIVSTSDLGSTPLNICCSSVHPSDRKSVFGRHCRHPLKTNFVAKLCHLRLVPLLSFHAIHLQTLYVSVNDILL